jgi:hypothetical protein
MMKKTVGHQQFLAVIMAALFSVVPNASFVLTDV